MNRITTIVASLAFASLTASLAFAGPLPPKFPLNSLGTAEPQRTADTLNASIDAASADVSLSPATPILKPQFNAGDLNHDGLVNIDDLLMVINAWGDHAKDKPSSADIAPAGGDSRVNFDDMLIVLMNWGA